MTAGPTRVMTQQVPHILFIDDEAPVRELLALYLRKKSFQVTTASDGAEARRLLAGGEHFDLAIVDLDLAGENGLDLLSIISVRKPALPAIVLTGLGSDAELIEQTKAAGARGFLAKTESLHAVFDEVSRVLLPHLHQQAILAGPPVKAANHEHLAKKT